MTNLGPLTTTFTPAGPDCASTFLVYYMTKEWVEYGAGSLSLPYLPSSFVPFYSYFYSPGICPSDYTEACWTQPLPSTQVSKRETRITCCPTSYECVSRRTDDPFACISYFTGVQSFDVSTFSYLTDSDGSTTAYAESGITSAGTTTVSLSPSSWSYSSTTAIETSPDSHRNSSHGFSQGAIAGIAVGSFLAAVFLIGTVALLLRRRRRLTEAHPAAGVSEIDVQVKPHQSGPSPLIIANYSNSTHTNLMQGQSGYNHMSSMLQESSC
ncbi:hypothetical protein GGR58DRAFT_503600 [Xylaria digitata]|nr:hypothetical protein GGR58DRAFT_503600 [Xylaria digitata]